MSQSSKVATAEINYLEEIPFRGRWLDSNWIGRCTSCKKQQSLWYGGANSENRKKMQRDYRGRKNCPSCVVKGRGHNSVDVYKRMEVTEAIKTLWLKSKTNMDYSGIEEFANSENKQEIQARENEIKSDWYLSKHKR